MSVINKDHCGSALILFSPVEQWNRACGWRWSAGNIYFFVGSCFQVFVYFSRANPPFRELRSTTWRTMFYLNPSNAETKIANHLLILEWNDFIRTRSQAGRIHAFHWSINSFQNQKRFNPTRSPILVPRSPVTVPSSPFSLLRFQFPVLLLSVPRSSFPFPDSMSSVSRSFPINHVLDVMCRK